MSACDASSSNGAHLAFAVLSSPLFFRMITPFASGWPYFILQRYKELKRTTTDGAAKWSPIRFLCALLRRGELPLVKQAVSAMWPHETAMRLTTKAVGAAIESGDTDTVHWAFEHGGKNSMYCEEYLYKIAITAFPGHCEVLEIMKHHEPLSASSFPFPMWQEVWTKIKGVKLLQWLVDNLSASCLPVTLLKTMAQSGRLSIVEYLMALPEQQVDGDVYLSVYHYHRGMNATGPIKINSAAVVAKDSDVNVKESANQVLALLLAQSTEPHGRELEEKAVGYGDIETLRLIHQTQGLVYLDSTDMDNLAAKGDLATLQFLLEKYSLTCTPTAMDGAATGGHLQVVQYLHETRPEGCTTAALDGGAASGHLEVVQYLHDNRAEGCTTAAMDQAACNGHMEIVQFLHTHRTEGCTARAMDDAAYSGHYKIAMFLHENRSEGCTTKTMDCLAARGDVELVMRLHQERTEGCSSAAMAYASPIVNSFALTNGRDARKVLFFLLENRKEMHGKKLEVDAITHGDLELLEWVHRTRGLQFSDNHNVDHVAAKGHLAALKMALTQGNAICTQAAMDGAAVNGHLDVVQFLHETQDIKTCSITTIHDAAKNGHWQVVAFLHENKYPWYPQIMLNFAARLGKLEFVERFSQGQEMDAKAIESAKNIAKVYHQHQVVAFLEERLQQNA